MTGSEFVRIDNYQTFNQVVREVNEEYGRDPAKVFASMAPGFLGQVTQMLGPWRGRSEMAIELLSAGESALAVGAEEEARRGKFDVRHVVALPGFEVAGRTHVIRKEDYLFGLTASQAAERALRPRLEFNRGVAEMLLDVVLQGAKSNSGVPQDSFFMKFKDQAGNTITKQSVSGSASQVPDVVAQTGQTLLWPLRDGTEASAGHDHLTVSAGAFSLAAARTQRDLITEHAGASGKVYAIVGKTVAEAIRTLMKSELGSVESRREFINLAVINGGGFCDAYPIIENLEGVNYWYSPDMPADTGLFFDAGKKPFYLSVGQQAAGGVSLDIGAWTEASQAEMAGMTKHGYRSYVSAGCLDPIAVAIAKFV